MDPLKAARAVDRLLASAVRTWEGMIRRARRLIWLLTMVFEEIVMVREDIPQDMRGRC
jgi:hypothetical protein